MSHAEQADKLLIKPAAGARPAPPHTRGQLSRGSSLAAATAASTFPRWSAFWKIPYGWLELWEARCSDGAGLAEAVRLARIEGLTLVVERVPEPR